MKINIDVSSDENSEADVHDIDEKIHRWEVLERYNRF
jgi:hypothetical protein